MLLTVSGCVCLLAPTPMITVCLRSFDMTTKSAPVVELRLNRTKVCRQCEQYRREMLRLNCIIHFQTVENKNESHEKNIRDTMSWTVHEKSKSRGDSNNFIKTRERSWGLLLFSNIIETITIMFTIKESLMESASTTRETSGGEINGNRNEEIFHCGKGQRRPDANRHLNSLSLLVEASGNLYFHAVRSKWAMRWIIAVVCCCRTSQ